MTPAQRARKLELIQTLREANVGGIRLTLDEAEYLLKAAEIPDLDDRLAANLDTNKYRDLYEQEMLRADTAEQQLARLQSYSTQELETQTNLLAQERARAEQAEATLAVLRADSDR